MDRLRRVLSGGTLVLVLGTIVAAAGCRSMRNEVPQGKPYPTTGGMPPSVGFNSDPRPNSSVGAGLYGNGMTPGQPSMPGLGTAPGGAVVDGMSSGAGAGASPPQLGTPAPNSGLLGQPTANRYGAPITPSIPPSSDTGR
jgi:hypothetical protein